MNDFFLLEICHLIVYQLPLPSLCDFPVHWNHVKKLHELVPFIAIHIFVTSSAKQLCSTSENYLPSCTWVTLQDKSSFCEGIPSFFTDTLFWPLLELSKFDKICPPYLQRNKIHIWHELHFFHFLAWFHGIVPCACDPYIHTSYFGPEGPSTHVLLISSSLSLCKSSQVQASPSLLSLLTFVFALS